LCIVGRGRRLVRYVALRRTERLRAAKIRFVGSPILILILLIVAVYAVAGVWRYVRQEFLSARKKKG